MRRWTLRRYIALYPLMLRLLPPDSPELGRQLAQLTDPELLWTPYGLRCALHHPAAWASHKAVQTCAWFERIHILS